MLLCQTDGPGQDQWLGHGTKLLVVVLRWASLIFCQSGLRAKPERKWFVTSISLRGKVGLNRVRSLVCPFGRGKLYFQPFQASQRFLQRLEQIRTSSKSQYSSL